MRLFRSMFFMGAIWFLMPTPPDSALKSAGITVSTPTLLSAAASAVADLGAFCGRQPGVCETASNVAGHLEVRAKYGVRLIYDWAYESNSQPQIRPLEDIQAEAADGIETGSLKDATVEVSQSTLTLEDYIPEWRGPEPARKG